MPLIGHDPKGRKIVVIRSVFDARKFSFDDFQKQALAITDIMLDEDEISTVNGFVVIVDTYKATSSHALQFTPIVVKKQITVIQVRYQRVIWLATSGQCKGDSARAPINDTDIILITLHEY